MPEELTTEYTMKNWREATKGWTFVPYSIGGYAESTVYIDDISAPGEQYQRGDFERDLRKVKRNGRKPRFIRQGRRGENLLLQPYQAGRHLSVLNVEHGQQRVEN